eukprot:TRINITY_DN40554_c0_g1_i3.p1 TRINITY_DN40554_c0_g1~~TRINITY_DN40554_c0_g1_i3.p1  ORF type:complete len:229 (-),score=40.95 TRINITY_DN40554_c0_g1_i3:456-1142(-)
MELEVTISKVSQNVVADAQGGSVHVGAAAERRFAYNGEPRVFSGSYDQCKLSFEGDAASRDATELHGCIPGYLAAAAYGRPPPSPEDVPFPLPLLLGNVAADWPPTGPSGHADVNSWPSDTTTVMLRQMPYSYSQEMLLEEVIHSGFAGEFDFLYVPQGNRGRPGGRGYGFINFVTPSAARRCRDYFQGRQFPSMSRKVVVVVAAALQGYEANVRFLGDVARYAYLAA